MMTRFTLVVWVLLVAVFPGCQTKSDRWRSDSMLDDAAQSRGELDQAYDMLSRIDEFERGPATNSLLAHLNNYLSEQKPDPKWEADPLVSRLPRQLRSLPPVKDLHSLEVAPTDALYLEEAYLLETIGNWVRRGALPRSLEAWARSDKSGLDRDAAQDLLSAWLLFDWTVRNVQLDPLPETPKEAVAGPSVGSGSAAEAVFPASLRGIPGPGYTGLPWYILMTGHGDAWQRARVFTLLARQQRIEVVTLALADPEQSGRPRPWVSAVLLGQQLYLFDPALGLPIPDATGQGIATLEQVRSDPSLLRALDVDRDHPYDVAGDEVKSVTALIDGSLEALSQRMRLIERGLSGERQLRLTIDAGDLESRLRKSPGIASVALWTVPVDALLFELAYRGLGAGFDAEFFQQMQDDRFLLDQRTDLSTARQRHLRGFFSDTAADKGAKSLYLESRIAEADIASLPRSEQMQQQLGLAEQLKELNPQDRANVLAMVQQRLRRGKQDASYWLGLVHYDSRSYEAAINWFDQHTLQAAPTGVWSAGARYNLGRSYEALEAYRLAQEAYLADEDSPQQHGNLLRAKRLQALITGRK